MPPPLPLKERIRQAVLKAGFDLCGFTDSAPLPEETVAHYRNWLRAGNEAYLDYMGRNFEKRVNPALLVEGVKTVVVAAINYFPVQQQAASSYRISKYAYGADYHGVIKQKLFDVVNEIPELKQSKSLRVFTDSAPVAERFLAVRAGLGFIGKNNLLIVPKKGNYLFLGEIFTDLEIEPDAPFTKQLCGSCTRCIDACPTKALNYFSLETQRCISFQTNANKDETVIRLEKLCAQKWIWGCDICLDVCPWNRFAKPTQEYAFAPNAELLSWSDDDWEKMDETAFNRIFPHSPIRRAGFKKLKNNIDVWQKVIE